MTLTHRVEAGHDVVAWLDRLMAVPKETTRDYQHLTQFQDELSAWAREPEWRRQLGARLRRMRCRRCSYYGHCVRPRAGARDA